MSKRKDEDRELQIELARLQIKHEHDISIYTVFLSVFMSMMLSVLSVYIPLGQVTNNLLYWWIAAIFNLALVIPIYRLMKGLAGGERQLSKDIQELKDRFLSKQVEEKKQGVKP